MVTLMEEHVPALWQSRGFGEKRTEDVDAKEEQGESDQVLGPAIDAGWKVDAEDDDDGTEERYGERMSKSIGHAQPHGGPFRVLDADDIGDCCDVVVVEAVAKAKQGGCKEGEIQGVVHEREVSE